jgi:hypothetical protein
LVHDVSKFSKEERVGFYKTIHKLKHTTYGSNEYKGLLQKIDPSLQCHYSTNRHHPEYHDLDEISSMTLVDIVEMFCDWKAAVRRHKDGDLETSINVNKDRFNISEQLTNVLRNSK